jgi:hypothetical protein
VTGGQRRDRRGLEPAAVGVARQRAALRDQGAQRLFELLRLGVARRRVRWVVAERELERVGDERLALLLGRRGVGDPDRGVGRRRREQGRRP